MDFKKEIINYLSDVEHKMRQEFNVSTSKSVKNYYKVRLADLENLIRHFHFLNFCNTFNSEIESCLSPYGTFCDRYTMYYSKQLEKLPIDQATMAIVFEYFNSIQNYFTHKLTDIKVNFIRNISMILCYHVGLIKEKMNWFSQSNQKIIFETFNKRYPNKIQEYVQFFPNQNAADYLKHKLIFNDPKQLLGKVTETIETLECNKYTIVVKSIECTKYGGIVFGYEDCQYIWWDINNQKFINGISKTAREAKDMLKLIDTLAQ